MPTLHQLKRFKRSARRALSKPLFKLLLWLLPWLFRAWVAVVWRTCRVRRIGTDAVDQRLAEGGGVALAVYHETVVPALLMARGWPVLTVTSRSDSGEVAARLVSTLGMEVLRGGSSRSRARRTPVVQDLIACVRDRPGLVVALTVDGSSGPRRRAKPGILEVARSTGLPVFVGHVDVRPCLRVPSWDRTILPVPFSRVTAVVTGPIEVPASVTSQQFQQLKARLQQQLDDTAEAAERGG